MKHWGVGLLLQAGMWLAVPAFAQVAEPAPDAPVAQAEAAPAEAAPVAAGTGTLVVDVKPFTSERELPKKVRAQLESGALEWGVRDDVVVFSLVNKRFIDFPLNHMTRYGQQETLSLPAGRYRITGIGLEMTTGFNVQKILDRGAYVNEDVLAFDIEAGKTTTLSINPVIYRDATFAVNFWMPTLLARVTGGAGESGESAEVPLNARGEGSIAWPAYGGPLKFVAD